MFRIEIDTTYGAFHDPDADSGYDGYVTALEIERITKEIMERLRSGWKEGKAIDVNGNVVGFYKLD